MKKNCNCGCNKAAKVMCITQVDSKKVLDPENIENLANIMLISKNMNGAWTLTPVSKVTMNAVVEAMGNKDAAFILMEMKEPPTSEAPETPEPNPDETEEPADPEETSDGE